MVIKKIFGLFILVLSMSTFGVATVQAENCETILFQRGAYSHTVKGVVPSDGTICYQIATRDRQTVDITIAGNNVIFSIGGVIDAQDRYSFTTEKKTYQIFVGQLMRSITNESFELMVSIK